MIAPSRGVTYPNGQVTSYAYYPTASEHRLQQIHHKRPGGATLNKFDYTYDVIGNIKTWSQQTDANPAQVYDYEYDPVDQLTAATLKATGGSILKRYRYAYDPAGNRTVEQIDNSVTGATFDNMNRLLSTQAGGALVLRGSVNEPASVVVGGQPATVNPDNTFTGAAQAVAGTGNVVVTATDASGNVRTNTYQITGAGTARTFTYDANGNTTSDGTKTYEWDGANRLVAVKQGATTLASFTYDGSGRRSLKTAGGVTTTFVYDGSDYLEERPNPGTAKRFVHGRGIDQPLAQVSGASATYNVADHLGSVVRGVDGTGSPTLAREYDPWGNLLQGAATSGRAYTGREWDAEVGLHYYRARYYDPMLARFLTEDPVAGDGALSSYLYGRNSPLLFSDPLGLRPGDKFKSQEKAVLDTYRWLSTNKKRDVLRWEFGGTVCKVKGEPDCYYCSEPRTDESGQAVASGRSKCSGQDKRVGLYHTHPADSLAGFSNRDMWIALDNKERAYLWQTKDGKVFRYEWVWPGLPVQSGVVPITK